MKEYVIIQKGPKTFAVCSLIKIIKCKSTYKKYPLYADKKFHLPSANQAKNFIRINYGA